MSEFGMEKADEIRDMYEESFGLNGLDYLWSFGSVMKVCGCNDEDGMGWEVKDFNKDVMVIGNVDGDVEFVVIRS